MKAERTLLDYSGLVLGMMDCIFLKREHKIEEASTKLNYIFEQIGKLKKDYSARESVLRNFDFELDVSFLEKLAVGLKDGKQSLEYLELNISQLHASLPLRKIVRDY